MMKRMDLAVPRKEWLSFFLFQQQRRKLPSEILNEIFPDIGFRSLGVLSASFSLDRIAYATRASRGIRHLVSVLLRSCSKSLTVQMSNVLEAHAAAPAKQELSPEHESPSRVVEMSQPYGPD